MQDRLGGGHDRRLGICECGFRNRSLGARYCRPGAAGVEREDTQGIEPLDQFECRVHFVRANFAGCYGSIEPAPALGRVQGEQFIENLLTPLFAV
jgi:hypothetical protein